MTGPASVRSPEIATERASATTPCELSRSFRLLVTCRYHERHSAEICSLYGGCPMMALPDGQLYQRRLQAVGAASGGSEPTVSVVIPAKNEARNLPQVFAGLADDLHEVILVDGDSTDDTVAVARRLRPGITVIGQTRKGKGNALACGFAAATGEFIVMLDADGSTDPKEIPRFVSALKQGADFAKGSRFMPGAGSSDISRMRQMGNFVLNKIVNILYGTRYTDLCYGYNAFRRDCLEAIDLDPSTEDRPDPGELRRGAGVGV